ncbi:unnamed protein product [Leptidea sinapis]|uniref:Serine/threonine-protein phosphatase 4 regulatory subunit 3-like central domain-containing protein n=1 Tax=Leptidea sinapis TaxID=189913 RepID=A0A5E4PPR4_9NEOP|nr:unnamed protein product [Leptidea sinapis]
MFWGANYTVARELKFLLKEENFTLAQVLEADDILQECKADNKDLIQFLTQPEILSELVTLIIEEPPKDVELTLQYRHANIACEVLTSQLSTLSHCLCMDAIQMNRLCDFVSRDPPLNPLLASYFSRTIETLDFFKAKREFLPNLLRHISTSAIADTFKYFICIENQFDKVIIEWFEEHQFLESLIQIICCTYELDVIERHVTPEVQTQNNIEKGVAETSEQIDTNHKDVTDSCKDADEDAGGANKKNKNSRVRQRDSAVGRPGHGSHL